MKYIKLFEDWNPFKKKRMIIDPFGEEDWDEKEIEEKPEFKLIPFSPRNDITLKILNKDFKKRNKKDRKQSMYGIVKPEERGELSLVDYNVIEDTKWVPGVEYKVYQKIICPRCGKKSDFYVDHAEVVKCGGCKLMYSIFKSSISIWN